MDIIEVDIVLSAEDIEEGAQNIFQVIRPQWKRQHVKMEVGILCTTYSKSQIYLDLSLAKSSTTFQMLRE